MFQGAESQFAELVSELSDNCHLLDDDRREARTLLKKSAKIPQIAQLDKLNFFITSKQSCKVLTFSCSRRLYIVYIPFNQKPSLSLDD